MTIAAYNAVLADLTRDLDAAGVVRALQAVLFAVVAAGGDQAADHFTAAAQLVRLAHAPPVAAPSAAPAVPPRRP